MESLWKLAQIKRTIFLNVKLFRTTKLLYTKENNCHCKVWFTPVLNIADIMNGHLEGHPAAWRAETQIAAFDAVIRGKARNRTEWGGKPVLPTRSETVLANANLWGLLILVPLFIPKKEYTISFLIKKK